MDRKTYVPVRDVLREMGETLQQVSRPDYITLSGSGEPTLHSRIGDIISGIKDMSDVPVAVLTNGSLLWIDEVCRAISGADLIIPSLDAGSEETFLRVNRPHSSIRFQEMVEGLSAVRNDCRGAVWLEVFITGGVTDGEDELSKIKALADRIGPERIQLNTAVRTPAEQYVKPVGTERLQEISRFFGPHCEVIASDTGIHDQSEFISTGEDVLDLLRRRPCSVEDISAGLGIHRNEAVKYVQELADKKLIRVEERCGKRLYSVH